MGRFQSTEVQPNHIDVGFDIGRFFVYLDVIGDVGTSRLFFFFSLARYSVLTIL
jgi:hypothetical protein